MSSTTDTSSYGQGNNGLGQALQIINLKNNLNKMKKNGPTPSAGPTGMASTASGNSQGPMSGGSTPVPYGQGTDMGLLGAGQSYGGSTPMPSSAPTSMPVGSGE